MSTPASRRRATRPGLEREICVRRAPRRSPRRRSCRRLIDFLFFWGHQPRHNGDTGQRCLSEARGPGPFIADGVTYPTASIWMTARKAQPFTATGPRPGSLPRVIQRALDALTAQLDGDARQL
jgi:hypothetical protein